MLGTLVLSISLSLAHPAQSQNLDYLDPASRNIHVDLSPDDKTVAFTSTTDDVYQDGHVWILPLDGRPGRKLAKGSMPRFSPDGKLIAFVATPDNSGGDSDQEIYIVPTSGGTPKRLTQNDTDDFLPAWSPDGLQVAFASILGEDTIGLHVIATEEAENGGAPGLRLDIEDVTATWPVILPTGEGLLFLSYDENSAVSIKSFTFDSENVATLFTPEPNLSFTFPTFSANGKWLGLQANLKDGDTYTTDIVALDNEDPTKSVRLAQGLDAVESFDISNDGTFAVASVLHPEATSYAVRIFRQEPGPFLTNTGKPQSRQAPVAQNPSPNHNAFRLP